MQETHNNIAMETLDDLMIVESSSSLHLTVSEDETSTPPGLSSVSSSCSTYEEDETEVSSSNEGATNHEGEQQVASTAAPAAAEEEERGSSKSTATGNDSMASGVSMEEVDLNNSMNQLTVETSATATAAATSASETEAATAAGDDGIKHPTSPIEIVNSEQQKDGSLYIEIKDDGEGDPGETASFKVQRLARKAGIIVGGGTMTAVGTVMLFLPCPTPSIYLMIGGMAVMAKEIPAAQRQLDTSRESLERALDRAEKEFAGGRKINIVVDNGKASSKTPAEQQRAIASTYIVQQQNNAVKKHFVKVGRNVILPLLNKVCSPHDGEVEEEKESDDATTNTNIPSADSDINNMEGKENDQPPTNPFVRFARYRENRREELLRAEEQREREAMLARINEANLKRCQQEALAAAKAKATEESSSPSSMDEGNPLVVAFTDVTSPSVSVPTTVRV